MSQSLSPAPYILVPQRLCLDLRDNPVAIGIYALTARLFLISHQAIPLSASDITRFDPQVSYGQARRALERLCAYGWLTLTTLGRKNAYTPTWGLINGAARLWSYQTEKLGRPPHVRTYRLGAEQLDQVAYITPHAYHTAVVHRSNPVAALASIGKRLLTHAGLLPSIADETVPFMCGGMNVIDQLIPQPIRQDRAGECGYRASECQTMPGLPTTNPIPWDSCATNQSTNQPAIIEQTHALAVVYSPLAESEQPSTATEPNRPLQEHQFSQSAYPDPAILLHPLIKEEHQALNPERHICPGEWCELHELEQRYGWQKLLIWQSRAQRREQLVERITPAYYHACAASDTFDTFQASGSMNNTLVPDRLASQDHLSLREQKLTADTQQETQHRQAMPQAFHADQHMNQAPPSARGRRATTVRPKPSEAHDRRWDSRGEDLLQQSVTSKQKAGMPASDLAAQLRSLGITALTGLGQCDPGLVAAWVEASRHPDWQQIWDDPGAAARALLLRGEPPPDAATIARRAAVRQRTAPVDWAAIVAGSQGMARLGDDLDGLLNDTPAPPVIDDSDQPLVGHPEYAGCQGGFASPTPLPIQHRYEDRPLIQEPDSTPVGEHNQRGSAYLGSNLYEEEPAEQLRQTLRLYASTRPLFQAVERLRVEHTSEQLIVIPWCSADAPLLRPMLPLLARLAAGRRVVLGGKPGTM